MTFCEGVRVYFWNTVLDILVWLDVRVGRAYLAAYARREKAERHD